MENYSRQFLIVIEGPNEGQAYPLQDMICTIGRTTDNTIVIDSTRISRHHTQIRLLPERPGTAAIVEDMGSTNGTWVNQRQLTGPQRLVPGDIITLADYVSFRYEVEDTLHTDKLVPTMPGSATQVMDDSPTYTPAPPPPPSYEEPYRPYTESPPPPQQPFIQLGSTPQTKPAAQPGSLQQPAWVPAPSSPAAPPAKRSKWVNLIIAILLVLICICLAIAVYLWFAPVTFWEQVFDLFNISIPQ